MCIFSFLCITEIYDNFLRGTLLKKEERQHNRNHPAHDLEEYDEEIECNVLPCLYELVFCGALRNCLIRDQAPGEEASPYRKKSRCGYLTFTTIAFLAGLVMEMSHFEFFSNFSPLFQPHYSVDESIDDDVKQTIWTLNLVKTIIVCSFFTLSIVFRSSFYVFAVLVCIFLWPVLLIHHIITQD